MPETFNKSRSAVARRIRAKERLEAQLKAGTKPRIGFEAVHGDIPLKKEDVTRIKREIEILKSRI